MAKRSLVMKRIEEKDDFDDQEDEEEEETHYQEETKKDEEDETHYQEETEKEEEDDDDDDDYSDGDSDDGAEEEEDEDAEDRRKKVMIRVYRGERRVVPSVVSYNSLCCQVDGCGVDLTVAKRYHRRHRVCEQHAKASIVLINGTAQRFCQQCSRFHGLSQFDGTKRSCRERLAGHNERRRKSHPDLQAENEPKPSIYEMDDRSLKSKGHPDCGELTLRGSSNIKHFRLR